MLEHLNKQLNEETLQRLAFFGVDHDFWHDIDYRVLLYKLLDGSYQQYVEDDNDEKIKVGIPLKTVEDLVKRYNSITGYQLRYHTGSLAIAGQ